MYVVAIAWLYVVFAAALTAATVSGGLLAFLLIGVGPVAIWIALDVHRRRRRREARSAGEPGVDGADDAEAETDQR